MVSCNQNSDCTPKEFFFIGTTPAYHAAQQGQLEALKYLCEKCKCKLTVASEDGAKSIHAAAQCGNTAVVQVF